MIEGQASYVILYVILCEIVRRHGQADDDVILIYNATLSSFCCYAFTSPFVASACLCRWWSVLLIWASHWVRNMRQADLGVTEWSKSDVCWCEHHWVRHVDTLTLHVKLHCVSATDMSSLVVSKLATPQISDFHVLTESNFIHDCTSCVKTSYPKANQKWSKTGF